MERHSGRIRGARNSRNGVPCAAPSRACAGPRQNRGPESEPEGRRSAGKRGAFERISRTCGLLRHAGACPDIVFLLEKGASPRRSAASRAGRVPAVRRFVRADHEIKVVGQRIGLVPDAFVRRGDSIDRQKLEVGIPVHQAGIVNKPNTQCSCPEPSKAATPSIRPPIVCCTSSVGGVIGCLPRISSFMKRVWLPLSGLRWNGWIGPGSPPTSLQSVSCAV